MLGPHKSGYNAEIAFVGVQTAAQTAAQALVTSLGTHPVRIDQGRWPAPHRMQHLHHVRCQGDKGDVQLQGRDSSQGGAPAAAGSSGGWEVGTASAAGRRGGGMCERVALVTLCPAHTQQHQLMLCTLSLPRCAVPCCAVIYQLAGLSEVARPQGCTHKWGLQTSCLLSLSHAA